MSSTVLFLSSSRINHPCSVYGDEDDIERVLSRPFLLRYPGRANNTPGTSCEQILKFWDAVGAAIASEIGSRRDDSPLWLSTCGTGVYW